jgi:hypothetical protein
MKPNGKSYLLPLFVVSLHTILIIYTMNDHSVGTQYRVILHGVNNEILKCPVINCICCCLGSTHI